MSHRHHVRIESPGLPNAQIEVRSVSGHDTISKLFLFDLLIVAHESKEVDTRKLLTSAAALVFERDGVEVSRMAGVIASIKDGLHSEAEHVAYHLRFVPRAWRLALRETSEIFMDRTVIDIITTKLDRVGLRVGEDVELRFLATYPVQEFLVQYQETDLAFISRLAEHHGICFFFEHQTGKDVIVFSDHNAGFPLLDPSLIPFCSRGEHVSVYAMDRTTHSLPGRYVVKDYNYRTPQVSLMATADVSGVGGDVVEYGAHFKTQDEAQRMATIRAQELLAREVVFDGRSDIQSLRAGTRFKLDGHPRADGEYLLTEVRHTARQGTRGTGHGDEVEYTNEFVAIPAKTPFRPARVTPKPKVHGVLHGIVEGPTKSQYAEVDSEGRYRVRFQFDTGEAEHGRASRPIRMAQPHAGPGYGFHFPLRDGVEVLLTCVEGDPDRPIIAGAVPNPTTPSTVGEKNSRRNVIRTGGGVELNLDDSEESTRLKMTVPHGNTVFQLGAPNLPAKGAGLSTDFDIKLTAGQEIRGRAHNNIDLSTEADMFLTAKANLFGDATNMTMDASTQYLVQAPLIHLAARGNLNMDAPWIDVKGGAKIRAGAPVVEVNSGTTNINAGINADTNAGFIALNGGKKVRVGAPVVEANGTTVFINGDGSISIKGGAVNISGSKVTIKGGSIDLNS